jgi:hypothetical protein
MDVSVKRSAAEFDANVIARGDDRATQIVILPFFGHAYNSPKT